MKVEHHKSALWAMLIIFALFAGCAATPQQSVLIGECKELLVPQRMWEGKESAFVGHNLLTASDVDEIFWHWKTVSGNLDAGTQVRIANILRGWNGSYGHFLRVQVEILDGPFRGWIAEVPSIAPYHPSPSWIMNWTLDPDALEFNPRIVRDCY